MDFSHEIVGIDKVYLSSDEENLPSEFEANDICSDGASVIDMDWLPVDKGMKRNSQQDKVLTKKRLCNPENWKRNVINNSVNLGLEYVSSSTKKPFLKRSIQRSCGLGCRFKCETKISEESRLEFFKDYWRIVEHSKKYDFLLRNVTENRITEDSGDTNKKQFSRTYSFNDRGMKIILCRTMFLNTLNISMQVLESAFKKIRNGDSQLLDERGRAKSGFKAVDIKITESVIEHINSFPRVESHYTRKDSNQDYLEEALTLSRMYALYVVKTKEIGKIGKSIATKHHYYDVFNTRFNISFHKPKKDQCDVCEC